jgi:hypothetical protein
VGWLRSRPAIPAALLPAAAAARHAAIAGLRLRPKGGVRHLGGSRRWRGEHVTIRESQRVVTHPELQWVLHQLPELLPIPATAWWWWRAMIQVRLNT